MQSVQIKKFAKKVMTIFFQRVINTFELFNNGLVYLFINFVGIQYTGKVLNKFWGLQLFGLQIFTAL